jgi:hypothetical protein
MVGRPPLLHGKRAIAINAGEVPLGHQTQSRVDRHRHVDRGGGIVNPGNIQPDKRT